MMRLLLLERSFERIESRLGAIPGQFEIIVMDDAGALWTGGRPVEPAIARPEVVWLSFETVAAKLFEPLMRLIPQFGTVKWVQTLNAGLDNPGYRAIFDAGIRVSKSDAQAISIAEYVLGNVIGEWQRLGELRTNQTCQKWKLLPLRELSQSSWLIIGFGNIGREVARRAAAFGADIVGVRSRRGSDDLARNIAAPEDIQSLLPQADVVVLACPLTEQTRGLAGGDFFAAMKPDSVLVNVARGRVLQDHALLVALDAGRPALAILDVFTEEPLPPDSPYWSHPRVRVSPHMSALGSGTSPRLDKLFLENLANYVKGLPLRNEVNKPP